MVPAPPGYLRVSVILPAQVKPVNGPVIRSPATVKLPVRSVHVFVNGRAPYERVTVPEHSPPVFVRRKVIVRVSARVPPLVPGGAIQSRCV